MPPDTPPTHRQPPPAESGISRSYDIMKDIIDGYLDEESIGYTPDAKAKRDLENLKAFYTRILQRYVERGDNKGGTIFHELLTTLHAAEQSDACLSVVGIYKALDDYKRFLIPQFAPAMNGGEAGDIIPLDMPWIGARDALSGVLNAAPQPQ